MLHFVIFARKKIYPSVRDLYSIYYSKIKFKILMNSYFIYKNFPLTEGHNLIQIVN